MVLPEFLKIENYNRWQFPVSDTRSFMIPAKYLTSKILIRYTPELGNLLDSGLLIYSVKIPNLGTYSQESFTVPVSLPNNRRFIDIDLDIFLPIELEFLCPNGVKKGYIELFTEKQTESATDFIEMPTNNPYQPPLTPADIAAGMIAAAPDLASAIAAENSIVLATQYEKETAKTTVDTLVTVTAWSGNAANHVVLPANTERLGIKAINLGNSRVYIDVGSPEGKQFNTFDEFIDRNGTFNSAINERALPLIMYLDAGKQSQQVSITELYPT